MELEELDKKALSTAETMIILRAKDRYIHVMGFKAAKMVVLAINAQ